MTTPVDPRWGLRLSEIRKAAQLSQGALAKTIGIARPSISQIENGDNYPGMDTLLAWLTACDGRLVLLGPEDDRISTVVAQAPEDARKVIELLVLVWPRLTNERQDDLRTQLERWNAIPVK